MVVTITARSLQEFPMYFSLGHFSLFISLSLSLSFNVCYSSVNTPILIIVSINEKKKKAILFKGFMTQIFSEHLLRDAEIILLSVIAYVWYVAICKLLY